MCVLLVGHYYYRLFSSQHDVPRYVLKNVKVFTFVVAVVFFMRAVYSVLFHLPYFVKMKQESLLNNGYSYIVIFSSVILITEGLPVAILIVSLYKRR